MRYLFGTDTIMIFIELYFRLAFFERNLIESAQVASISGLVTEADSVKREIPEAKIVSNSHLKMDTFEPLAKHQDTKIRKANVETLNKKEIFNVRNENEFKERTQTKPQDTQIRKTNVETLNKKEITNVRNEDEVKKSEAKERPRNLVIVEAANKTTSVEPHYKTPRSPPHSTLTKKMYDHYDYPKFPPRPVSPTYFKKHLQQFTPPKASTAMENKQNLETTKQNLNKSEMTSSTIEKKPEIVRCEFTTSPKKVPRPEPDTHQEVYRLTQHPGNKDSVKISTSVL